MVRPIFAAFLVLISLNLYAQEKRDWTWVVGDDSDFHEHSSEILGLMEIHFLKDTFHINESEIGLDLDETSASICDEEGSLLFYTNGTSIANVKHQVMENGDSINPGAAYDWNVTFGRPEGYRVPQGTIILPLPGSKSVYYVFHLWVEIINLPNRFWSVQKLLYSVVDMSANNGLGKVLEKNVEIFHENYLYFGQLTAIRHGNGRDWWLICKGEANDKYFLLLFTPKGIEGPMELRAGIPSLRNSSGSGQAVFTPDGTKYIHFGGTDGIFLFDFDRCEGSLSGFRHIPPPEENTWGWGAAVSPNSRFLYVSYFERLYQYDLWANDIAASVVLIDEYDGFMSPFWATFYLMQLAPNGKIYMCANNGVDVLHVINRPDEKGKACDFRQHGVPLPSTNGFGVPNFPHFGVYDLEGSPCDTLGINAPVVSAVAEPGEENEKTIIFPNPAGEYIRIEAPAGMQALRLELYTMEGRRIWEEMKVAPFEKLSLPLKIKNGMYYYSIIAKDGRRWTGRLAVMR